MKPIEIVNDFFNKLTQRLDKKYFPTVKYYRDDKKCTAVHFAVELFNNGCLSYNELIKRLTKNCQDTKANIEAVVDKYLVK